MKRTVWFVLWVGFVLGAIMPQGGIVRALSTTDGYLTDEPQLYVSAYQRTDDGLGLKFVQLYNNSDNPIDITTWGIYFGEIAPEHKLGLAAAAGTYLEPDTHVILSSDGAVDGASYEITTPTLLTTTPDKASLTLVPPAGLGLRTVVYDMKYTKVTTTKNAYYEIWQRNQTTTGYSSTTTSFTALPASSTTEPHYSDHVSLFDNGLYQIPAVPDVEIVEVYAYASDCDPFDTSVLCGDYIKLKVNDPAIELSQYVLRSDSNSSSRTSSNTFWLGGLQASNSGYVTVYHTDDGGRIGLTNSGGYIWLEDIYGLTSFPVTMTKYVSATSDHQGWSYARSDGTWQWTSTPQPDQNNLITVPIVVEEIKPCPAGQYRNPETNRCRAIEEAVNALAACPEGHYRNPETNRCKSAAITASAGLVPCGEGQERNPATNRCRSIASAVVELIPCDEGYERNPATNRCRKLLGVSTAAPSLLSPAEANTNTTGAMLSNPYAIAAVVGLGGVGYALYEWRSEIGSGFKRLAGKLGKK